MIEIIGSIASILGLAIQLFEKSKNEEDKMIIFLICLSEKSKHLKTVHTVYHNLYYGFTDLNNFLINPREAPRYKRVSDVDKFQLSQKIVEPLLISAGDKLRNELSVDINKLGTSVKHTELTNNEKFKFLKANNESISTSIEKIIKSQENVVNLHNQYCEFFEKLRPMQEKDDLHDEDVKIILKYKHKILGNFNGIINDTDLALMNYLDIYHSCMTYLKHTKRL